MTLSQHEYETIINDDTKVILQDIAWEGKPNSYAQEFRVDIDSNDGYPIFLKGWFNPFSHKLSYSIILRGVGRIYGLDLGAEHCNPDGRLVGEKHKNYWYPGSRDKWAFVPRDITATWDRPLEVWEQFCQEANLSHQGNMNQPVTQSRFL